MQRKGMTSKQVRGEYIRYYRTLEGSLDRARVTRIEDFLQVAEVTAV
jgi:hypothetical protein